MSYKKMKEIIYRLRSFNFLNFNYKLNPLPVRSKKVNCRKKQSYYHHIYHHIYVDIIFSAVKSIALPTELTSSCGSAGLEPATHRWNRRKKII